MYSVCLAFLPAHFTRADSSATDVRAYCFTYLLSNNVCFISVNIPTPETANVSSVSRPVTFHVAPRLDRLVVFGRHQPLLRAFHGRVKREICIIPNDVRRARCIRLEQDGKRTN